MCYAAATGGKAGHTLGELAPNVITRGNDLSFSGNLHAIPCRSF